jgi:hypothetical protein
MKIGLVMAGALLLVGCAEEYRDVLVQREGDQAFLSSPDIEGDGLSFPSDHVDTGEVDLTCACDACGCNPNGCICDNCDCKQEN